MATVTALEEKLARYAKPSSDTEQDKQERAERMVRSAVSAWGEFDDISVTLLAKGSYKNNTNVRADSDVDIAVIHEGLYYYDDSLLREAGKPKHEPITVPHFDGPGFRGELEKAMCDKYGEDCDVSGNTAIEISENSGRVKADVVPSFRYRLYYYDSRGNVTYHAGTKTWRTDGSWVVNYPQQQYDNGVAKNNRTGKRYKRMARILKRVENDLAEAGTLKALPSYFMECLVYCVPDTCFNHGGRVPLTDDITSVVGHIWNATKKGGAADQWYEPNGIKPLFGEGQKWSIDDAHDLTLKAWQKLGLS